MISADELIARIKAEAHLTEDPPIGAEGIETAADTALRLWGDDGGGHEPLTPAA